MSLEVVKGLVENEAKCLVENEANKWYKGDTCVQPNGEVDVLGSSGNPQ